jgi:uncharacterized protein with von Willebrand factor type A (vWA) domain
MNAEQTLDTLGANLSSRWVAFGRLLRRNGVDVTPAQVRDLLRVLPMLNLTDRESVYFAARATLCSRKSDLPRFDSSFRQFWGRSRHLHTPSDTNSLRKPPPSQPRNLQPPVDDRPPRLPRTLPDMERIILVDTGEDKGEDAERDTDQDRRLERALLYSAEERLRHIDFSKFSEEELASARAIMSGWQWTLAQRRTRRMTPAKRGSRLDIVRTLRRAMRTGGVPYTLATRGPRRKVRPLVLLCDISGSMASYTRVLLYFMHTIRKEAGKVEVFLFGTRLTRVTRQLRARDVDQALAEVGRKVVDWSGGTRIGEVLHDFNTQWARRVLGQGAIVCIISDGWDRGDPTLLATEMDRLQRTSFRLIWLNPLMGGQNYQPLTRGMVTALRYVDHLLPAHDLASLKSLARLLATLDANARLDRRQRATRN